MMDEKEFIEKVLEVIGLIDKDIENVCNSDQICWNQLMLCRRELSEIAKNVAGKSLPPKGMREDPLGRMIVDSECLSKSRLGRDILILLDIYLRKLP